MEEDYLRSCEIFAVAHVTGWSAETFPHLRVRVDFPRVPAARLAFLLCRGVATNRKTGMKWCCFTSCLLSWLSHRVQTERARWDGSVMRCSGGLEEEQNENRNRKEREPEPGAGVCGALPRLGGSADSTAEWPRAGSSVSIMVSLQIIYTSPLLLCCPQAHKARFSMLLLAKGVGETSSEVYCGWSKGVRLRTNAYRHARALVRFGFDEGWPQGCYSYQNDTFAAFAYSWINAAEGKHASGMSALPTRPPRSAGSVCARPTRLGLCLRHGGVDFAL